MWLSRTTGRPCASSSARSSSRYATWEISGLLVTTTSRRRSSSSLRAIEVIQRIDSVGDPASSSVQRCRRQRDHLGVAAGDGVERHRVAEQQREVLDDPAAADDRHGGPAAVLPGHELELAVADDLDVGDG